MKRLFLILTFVLGNFSMLLLALLFMTVYSTQASNAAIEPELEILDTSSSQSAEFNTIPVIPKSSALIISKDARSDLIDNFFSRYSSPMYGLGKDIVLAADKYQIPYGYLPAIAACEGALGQKIPYNSYNTWGWGIYGDLVTSFSSWQHGIDTVAKGLKQDYFNLGLDTPEKIMPKYTPPSKGSWAICVQGYLDELR